MSGLVWVRGRGVGLVRGVRVDGWLVGGAGVTC